MKNALKRAVSIVKVGRWFTFASVIVMSFTFFMLSVVTTIALISSDVLKYLESRAQITLFFKDEVSEEQILSELGKLKSDTKVLEATYTSKEQALEKYISDHKDEPVLLENLNKDIFPASIDLRARDIASLGELSNSVKTISGIEEVVFYEDAVNTFKKFSNAIKFGGLVLVGLLFFTSVVVVFLTLGSSIYVRKDEIGVMRLVGASNSYIRTPFILQGLMYGVLASVISQIFFVSCILFLKQDISLMFKGIPIASLGVLYLGSVFLIQLFFAFLISLVAGYIAVKRYLKI